MKRAMMFAAALMAGMTLVGGTVQTQAAVVKTAVIKKVAVEDQNTLKDCLEQLEKQQWGNCTVIAIPCVPGQAPGTPDAPETDKPGTPDTETPDNSTPGQTPGTPDTSKPDAPDNSKPETGKPETPDTSKPETPDTDAPDNSTPGQTPETPDTDAPDNSTSETDYHAYVLRVVELVNEERAKAGLKPLTIQKGITAAAQVRAQETEISFSHTRPDGRSFATALTEAGVTYRGSGENIAWGQKTPEQVMNGWMNSAGHRANILNEKYTSIGVGYYQNANGTNYWTQLFTY